MGGVGDALLTWSSVIGGGLTSSCVRTIAPGAAGSWRRGPTRWRSRPLSHTPATNNSRRREKNPARMAVWERQNNPPLPARLTVIRRAAFHSVAPVKLRFTGKRCRKYPDSTAFKSPAVSLVAVRPAARTFPRSSLSAPPYIARYHGHSRFFPHSIYVPLH